jgi:hypothetical protein
MMFNFVRISVRLAGAGSLIIVFVLLQAITASAADQDIFDIYTLEVEGEIYGYVTGDFDGDNLNDIALIYLPLRELYTRYLGLYLNKGANGFRSRADHLIPLDGSIAQIDAGDIDADGTDEILVIDGDGVDVFRFQAGSGLVGPTTLIEERTIYTIPRFHGILSQPFILDIVARPGPEIIVPVPDGFAVYARMGSGRYSLLSRLDAPLFGMHDGKSFKDMSRHIPARISFTMPAVSAVDGNGDGATDLYFLWDQRIYCFFQNDSGGFAREPDIDLVFFGNIPSDYMESYLLDCNGDGRMDVAVSCTSGGLTSTETRLRLFLADGTGHLADTQTTEIRLSDSHCNLLVNDYNYDGHPELVVSALEMGVIAASKMFLLKKADMHLLIYPVLDQVPENQPSKRLDYEFRFNFDDPNPTGEVSINWEQDYNDDSLLDAVLSDGAGRLLFFWGEPDDYLSKKPDLEVRLDHPSSVTPVRLNNGPHSDLIVEHSLEGRLDRLTVLMNRLNR